MTIIEFEDRVIYRAGKHKKVKFKNDDRLYSEIVLKEKSDNVEEVKA